MAPLGAYVEMVCVCLKKPENYLSVFSLTLFEMYDVSADLNPSSSVSLSIEAPLGNSSGSFIPIRAMSFSVSNSGTRSYEALASPVADESYSPAPLDVAESLIKFNSSGPFADSVQLDQSAGTPDFIAEEYPSVALVSESAELDGAVAASSSNSFEIFGALDLDSIATAVIDNDSGWLNLGVDSEYDPQPSESLDSALLASVVAVKEFPLVQQTLDSGFDSSSLIDVSSADLMNPELGRCLDFCDTSNNSFGSMPLEIGISDLSFNSSVEIASDYDFNVSLNPVKS